MRRLRIQLVLLAALAPSLAHAQVDTGSIVGTVRDKSGAIVPGASVSVRESTTNTLTSSSPTPRGTTSRRRCGSASTR